jgi:nucleotide-binding universal stress UspA family protein
MTLGLLDPVVRIEPEHVLDFETHAATRVDSVSPVAPQVILHPTDSTPESQQAFELACRLARNSAGRVIVLHVTSTRRPALPGMAGACGDRSARDERLRTNHPPHEDTQIEHQFAEGDAAEQILRIAREQNCDLILMASHAATRGLRLRQSVASIVSRKAPCPVAVLTSSSHRRPLFSAPDGTRQRLAGRAVPNEAMPRLRSILHPTDFSPAANAAFDLARLLTQDARGDLDVLHAVPRSLYFASRRHRAEVKQKLQQMAQPDTGSSVRSHVLPGDAISETVWLAREVLSNLIVVGQRGHGIWKRLWNGSVSRDIQRRVDCPVLTVTLPRSVTAENLFPWARSATAPSALDRSHIDPDR